MKKKLKESFFGNTTIKEVMEELSAPEQLEKVRVYDLDNDKVLFEGHSSDMPKNLLSKNIEGMFIFDAEFVVSAGPDKRQMWESKLSGKPLSEAYSDMASAMTADGKKVIAVGSTRHTRTYNYEDVTFRFGSREGKGSYRWQNRPWQRFDFADALIQAMVDAGIEDAFARECIQKTNNLDRALEYFAQNYKATSKQEALKERKCSHCKTPLTGASKTIKGKKYCVECAEKIDVEAKQKEVDAEFNKKSDAEKDAEMAEYIKNLRGK